MKFYRIGNQLFDFETLESSRIEVDGSNIVIGWRKCKLATAAEAQKAFDRIAAILGAEDLCGDEEMEMREEDEAVAEPANKGRWVPEDGGAYWTIVDGDVIEYTWDGDQGDDIDREQFDAGLVFRTQKEAEAALAKLMGPPPEATHEAQPELTVDDLAPRKAQEFSDEYWFAGAHWTGSCSWDADFTDKFRNIIGLAAQTRAEARAIADALAVIQEIKERSTCPPTVERCVAIDITDEEGHGLWSVSFGRFAHDIEADAVDAHIGEARLRNAANWVRGLPLLIEKYGDEDEE